MVLHHSGNSWTDSANINPRRGRLESRDKKTGTAFLLQKQVHSRNPAGADAVSLKLPRRIGGRVTADAGRQNDDAIT